MTPNPLPRVIKEIQRFYALFAASQFLIDSAIWSFYLVQYCGVSLTGAVAFNASITALSGFLDLPTGSWADRFGRRRIVALGFLSRALSALIMIVVPNTTGLVLAALLAGFGWAQMSGAAEAFFHDNLKHLGYERDFKNYMANVVITNYVSRAIAFAISGVLFSVHPTMPYTILFVVTCLGAAMTLAIPEHPYTRSESTTDVEHIKDGVRVFWNTPNLFGVALLIFFAHVTAEQLWFSFQPLLSLAGAGPRYSGFTYAIASGGSVLGAYCAKWFLRRHREDLVLAFALCCFGFGALLFTLTATPLGVTGAQIISCLGFGALWSGSSALLNAHLPSSHRAVCLSILSACETATMGILGCFVGYIFETFNRTFLPITVALVSACLAPCLYFRVARLRASRSDGSKLQDA